jgi:hypothetical protein
LRKNDRKPPVCARPPAAVPYRAKEGPACSSKQWAEDLRAVLAAYRTAKGRHWPQLHPAMVRRAPQWATAGEAELSAELEGYLKESDAAEGAVRVFWKTEPKFLFAGCNERFVRDAGLASADLMGTDDFDSRLPWATQLLASIVTWTSAFSLSASRRSGFRTPSSYTASTSIVTRPSSGPHSTYCAA